MFGFILHAIIVSWMFVATGLIACMGMMFGCML